MKTAVDWLVDHLYWVIPDEERNFLEGLRKEALEKEKEQIIEAYEAAMERPIENYAESYYNMNYNQTYNQTNVGNDGFEFDNSSTIPPPKKK
jgi:hypothetical protein